MNIHQNNPVHFSAIADARIFAAARGQNPSITKQKAIAGYMLGVRNPDLKKVELSMVTVNMPVITNNGDATTASVVFIGKSEEIVGFQKRLAEASGEDEELAVKKTMAMAANEAASFFKKKGWIR